MKQLCVAAAGLAALSVSSVSAADLAAHAPAPAPVVAPATSWSGFYLGAQGGGGDRPSQGYGTYPPRRDWRRGPPEGSPDA